MVSAPYLRAYPYCYPRPVLSRPFSAGGNSVSVAGGFKAAGLFLWSRGRGKLLINDQPQRKRSSIKGGVKLSELTKGKGVKNQLDQSRANIERFLKCQK